MENFTCFDDKQLGVYLANEIVDKFNYALLKVKDDTEMSRNERVASGCCTQHIFNARMVDLFRHVCVGDDKTRSVDFLEYYLKQGYAEIVSGVCNKEHHTLSLCNRHAPSQMEWINKVFDGPPVGYQNDSTLLIYIDLLTRASGKNLNS